MWTPADRALVGDYGASQVLSDDRYRLLEPFIPAAEAAGATVVVITATHTHPFETRHPGVAAYDGPTGRMTRRVAWNS